MAQIAIREYDAKRMFAEYTHTAYTGILITGTPDFPIETSTDINHAKFVIKPDQLFGKRGKYGLVGVNLNLEGVKAWWEAKHNTTVNLKGQEGILHTFLVEPFVPHTSEYYTAIKTERDHDILYFSETGGMDVEEHWESVREIQIPLGKNTPDL